MGYRKRIIIALVVLTVAVLVALSFRPKPIAVSAATVNKGLLRVTVEQEGRVRVRNRFVLTAPVPAYAPRIDLEVGDSVAKGQVLFKLQPQPSTLLSTREEKEARAAVAEAEAAWQYARTELSRIRKLYARGDVSESALSEAEAKEKQARANLMSAQARLMRGGIADSGTAATIPVTSPVDGQVLSIQHKSAGAVAGGESLLTVGNAGALEVAVDVLSEDAVRIRPGMKVRLVRWGGGEDLEARVRRVEPTAFTKVSALGVEEQRVWVISDITSPRAEWANLGDGYRVEASFILWEGDNVTKAPTSALFRSGEGWAVFVIHNGRAKRRPVRVGHRSALEAEIIEGLRPGEQVVTHPGNSLSNNTRVEVRTP